MIHYLNVSKKLHFGNFGQELKEFSASSELNDRWYACNGSNLPQYILNQMSQKSIKLFQQTQIIHVLNFSN